MPQNVERSAFAAQAGGSRLRALAKQCCNVAAKSYARLSAALIVYFPVMGALGFGVLRGEISFENPPTDCWPYLGEWGFINSACPAKAVNLAWFFLLGVSRTLLFSIATFWDSAIYRRDDIPGQVLAVLILLSILALLFGPGVWFWWRTRRWVVWTAVPLLIAEALVLDNLH